MSLENHPNFNVAKFAVEIVESYYNSIRNNQDIPKGQYSDAVRGMTVSFVDTIESIVDKFVEDSKKFEK